jgi:hypothetical protein
VIVTKNDEAVRNAIKNCPACAWLGPSNLRIYHELKTSSIFCFRFVRFYWKSFCCGWRRWYFTFPPRSSFDQPFASESRSLSSISYTLLWRSWAIPLSLAALPLTEPDILSTSAIESPHW